MGHRDMKIIQWRSMSQRQMSSTSSSFDPWEVKKNTVHQSLAQLSLVNGASKFPNDACMLFRLPCMWKKHLYDCPIKCQEKGSSFYLLFNFTVPRRLFFSVPECLFDLLLVFKSARPSFRIPKKCKVGHKSHLSGRLSLAELYIHAVFRFHDMAIERSTMQVEKTTQKNDKERGATQFEVDVQILLVHG